VLKPQDVFVALKIAALGGERWTYPLLAEALGMSLASVHESTRRAMAAGLINARERRAIRPALEEFLVHGLRYAFAPERGRITRGMLTAGAAPVFHGALAAPEVPLIWPHAAGTVRGESLTPLCPSVPDAASRDEKLYGLLALADALRVGTAREREVAARFLKELLSP
jgi:hypothetical protein